MFFKFFFYKIIIIDYLFILYCIIPVFTQNKNLQSIEKKLIKISIWLLLGLPFFLIFFFKLNFFLENIIIAVFFLTTNTILILLYFENIQNLVKNKKNFKYYYNKNFLLHSIIIYSFIFIAQLILLI